MLSLSSVRLPQEMDKQSKTILLYDSNSSLIAALDEETVSAAWNAFGT